MLLKTLSPAAFSPVTLALYAEAIGGQPTSEAIEPSGGVSLNVAGGTPETTATPSRTPTPAPTGTPRPPTPTPRCGHADVHIDGDVDALDALLILQYVADLVDSLSCVERADADGNGSIEAIDAALILQIQARLGDWPTPTSTPTPSSTPLTPNPT
jgi:hypothetical protein